MPITEYHCQHAAIRARMLAEKYPSITDPGTTVYFMIPGLGTPVESKGIGLQMLLSKPTELKDFVDKYNKLRASNNATGLTAHHTSPVPPVLPVPPPTKFSKPSVKIDASHAPPKNRAATACHSTYKIRGTQTTSEETRITPATETERPPHRKLPLTTPNSQRNSITA